MRVLLKCVDGSGGSKEYVEEGVVGEGGVKGVVQSVFEVQGDLEPERVLSQSF